MSLLSAALVALAIVVVATAIGLILKRRDGRIREFAATAKTDTVTPSDLGLPEPSAFGSGGTLVQFSTEFCTRCPQTSRLLGQIADQRHDVAHVDIDLTHRPDLARHFGILQTPTTLVLDATGRVRARIAGPPERTAVIRHIDETLGSRV